MSEKDPVHGDEARRWGGWYWENPSRGEHFRRCSFCGCIHPVDLVAEPAWAPQWADRKYGWPHKFYVVIPNRKPEAIFCIGSRNFPATEPPYISTDDLSAEQVAVVKRDGMGLRAGNSYLFGTRVSHHAKFYTVHLADPALVTETREAIERGCGLRFTFSDDGVRWTVPPTKDCRCGAPPDLDSDAHGCSCEGSCLKCHEEAR